MGGMTDGPKQSGYEHTAQHGTHECGVGSPVLGFRTGVDEVMLARAYLSRVAEPACISLWGYVRDVGPVTAARAIRAGSAPSDVVRATVARAAVADPEADLTVAERHGIRLVYPEAPDWPHFAMACLEQTGLRRLAEYRNGQTSAAEHGEPIPPLALWIRGNGDLVTLGVRSVGIVGARAATAYGERVAADMAFGLAGRGFAVVSGGAFGIDASAHRGALGAGGTSYLVSAGGLDAPYPSANARLFEQCMESGLLISESPPGAAPKRRRFLTRNRLIAALSTGTVVVEASKRSGAVNTAGHCVRLDRPLMVVPGPVTSAMSVGCHELLHRYEGYARMVTSVEEVVGVVGSLMEAADQTSTAGERGSRLQQQLDEVDESARVVFDSFPARDSVGPDDLVALSGLPISEVLAALSVLELACLIRRAADGYRIVRSADRSGTCDSGKRRRRSPQFGQQENGPRTN
jgi:DNA processing protein